MSAPSEKGFAENRRRLLDAASEAFLEEGYRASIEGIAARAGVAKQTLYNHFQSKDALFGEVVGIISRSILVTLENRDASLRDSLLKFAATYREKLLSPRALALFRMVAAEAGRFPELGRTVFAAGPAATVRQLARYLDAAMERGDMRRDNPRLAAEMLVGMLGHFDRLRGLLNGEADIAADPGRSELMVDCFLRAYATGKV